jgi:hypothetical protein
MSSVVDTLVTLDTRQAGKNRALIRNIVDNVDLGTGIVFLGLE